MHLSEARDFRYLNFQKKKKKECSYNTHYQQRWRELGKEVNYRWKYNLYEWQFGDKYHSLKNMQTDPAISLLGVYVFTYNCT